MPRFHNIAYLLTLLLAALIAGLLYGYACSVNPGLGRLNDIEYLKAMQSINSTIRNPVFFSSFIGTLVMLPLCAWLSRRQSPSIRSRCLLVASLVYFIGVFGVTAAGNIPLNNALEAINIDVLSVAALRQQRMKFEGSWNNYHLIRTVCSIVSFVLAAFPFIRKQRHV